MTILNKTYYLLLILCAFILTSCQLGEQHYVDFTDISSANGMFRVVSQRNTDMQQLVEDPNQLAMWGLDVAHDIPGDLSPAQRASSVTMNDVVQSLLDVSNMSTAIELSGTIVPGRC